MKLLNVALVTPLLASAVVVKDPAKCAKYTPSTVDGAAGTWAIVNDTDQQNCLAQDGQWILGWGQSLYPDHHPVPKTWWTKRMSDTGGADSDYHDRLYFSGRPAVRDMKQLYEGGFDAVLSLEDAAEGETLGIQPLPSTAEARKVAAEAGLLFHSLPAAMDFTSQQGVDEISNFLDFALANTGSNVNGPLLVFDKAGFKAAAALQLFRARKGLIPKSNSKSVTERATKEGNFHGIEFPMKTIEAIAREAKEETLNLDDALADIRELPAAVADSLNNYHWLKYLYHIGNVGVYDAGQVQGYHVAALQAANIKSIINMRQGATTESGDMIPATEEPVNLLNLEFSPATKGITDAAAFAADPVTGALVIDKDRPASWACQFETVDPESYTECKEQAQNFETMNPLEWGDIGQNALAEGEDFQKAGIAYYHLPVGAQQQPAPKPFNAATFAEYAPQFIEAVNVAQKLGGNVLFHCTIGYRTGAFPTALLAVLSEMSVHDANTMMHSWGYDVVDEQTGHVFEVGTNTLFKALNTLKFEGETNWDTGRIDGQILMASESAPTPATPAGGGLDDDDDHDHDNSGLLAAVLIVSILAFVLAAVAVYMICQKNKKGYARTPISAEIEESEMTAV